MITSEIKDEDGKSLGPITLPIVPRIGEIIKALEVSLLITGVVYKAAALEGWTPVLIVRKAQQAEQE